MGGDTSSLLSFLAPACRKHKTRLCQLLCTTSIDVIIDCRDTTAWAEVPLI